MTDPVSKSKGFGDAALAREVIERYAEGGAKSVWVSPEKDQNAVLKAVLTDGPYTRVMGPEISPGEREQLGDAGFSQEFIETLAGLDGKRALRERVKWLGDHAVKKFWRIGPDDYERTGWILELKNIGRDAVEALPQLLLLLQQDLSPHVKRAVVDALGEIGPTAADTIPEIVKAGDVSSFVKIRALGFIAARPEISIPFILWAFQKDRGGDSNLFKETSEALSNFGITAIPYLLEGMADKDENIRDVSADAFGKINWKKDPEVRKMVEKAAPQILPKLVERLKESAPLLGRTDSINFITALANFGRVAVTPIFRNLPNDFNSEQFNYFLCGNSIDVLSRIGSEAIPQLMALIRTESGMHRIYALEALKKMGPEAAAGVPELVSILDNKELWGKEIHLVVGVLAGIGSAAGPALVAGLDSSPVWGQMERIETLEEIPHAAEVYPFLLPFLKHEEWRLRVKAVHALSIHGEGHSEVPLAIAPLLNDPKEGMRWMAMHALTKLASRTPNCHMALPLLLVIRDNPDEKEDLRNAARSAIQAIEEAAL